MNRTFNAKGFVKLTPDNGKVLYNGQIISDCAFIPLTVDYNLWEDVSLTDLYTSDDGVYLKKTYEEENTTPFIYYDDDDNFVDVEEEEVATEEDAVTKEEEETPEETWAFPEDEEPQKNSANLNTLSAWLYGFRS